MRMHILVGLKLADMHIARESGTLPDFRRVFNGFSDVRLLEVVGRGRFAQFEMTDDAYQKIKSAFGDRFNFSKERELEPFSSPPAGPSVHSPR